VKQGAIAAMALMVAALGSVTPATAQTQEINVYSYREPQLVEPMLKLFTERTGIKTRLVFAKDGLVERMAAEGRLSPADILLSTDIARLTEAKAQRLTDTIEAGKDLDAGSLKDADGQWVALTMRARVIYASKERVKDATLSYEDLADPKWKGKICSRSGQHPYNTAMIAAMIAHKGEAAAETWLEGVKANLARKPSGGDRDVAKDIAAGICDIGLGNTYYVGLMQANPDQKDWAAAIKVIMPTFSDGGTHVNLSGFAIAKNAPNRAEAEKLGEWLVSEKAQELYASANFEYPVREGVAPSPVVASFGTLVRDTLPLADIAANRAAASEMVDAVGFDN